MELSLEKMKSGTFNQFHRLYIILINVFYLCILLDFTIFLGDNTEWLKNADILKR